MPRIGPLTDLESGLWDSCDFYFGVLHARQMEGTVPESIARYHYCMSFHTFSNAGLRLL